MGYMYQYQASVSRTLLSSRYFTILRTIMSRFVIYHYISSFCLSASSCSCSSPDPFSDCLQVSNTLSSSSNPPRLRTNLPPSFGPRVNGSTSSSYLGWVSSTGVRRVLIHRSDKAAPHCSFVRPRGYARYQYTDRSFTTGSEDESPVHTSHSLLCVQQIYQLVRVRLDLSKCVHGPFRQLCNLIPR
jgi:hypothetical protein